MTLTVGVDVGGTKIAAGVVDEHGVSIDRVRKDSPNTAPVLRAAIGSLVRELASRHAVGAVGLGAPGFVGADQRSVTFTPNLPWRNEPIADLLEADLGLPVVVENDANAAAWTEYVFGADRGVPDQLMITLGTGIGGGLILGGQLYRGGGGFAAEIGHMTVVPDGVPCGCGRCGCLEQYASGKALERDARAAAAAGSAPALLDSAGGAVGNLTGALVTELALSGAPEALAHFEQLGRMLACGIGSLVALLDPKLVLIGGGLGDTGELVLNPTIAALTNELTDSGHRPAPRLVTAQLGNDAGLIGAGELAPPHANDANSLRRSPMTLASGPPKA